MTFKQTKMATNEVKLTKIATLLASCANYRRDEIFLPDFSFLFCCLEWLRGCSISVNHIQAKSVQEWSNDSKTNIMYLTLLFLILFIFEDILENVIMAPTKFFNRFFSWVLKWSRVILGRCYLGLGMNCEVWVLQTKDCRLNS